MTTIAVDAMGGDRAPEAVLHGARAALADEPDLSVILVGDADALRAAGLDAGVPCSSMEQLAAARRATTVAAPAVSAAGPTGRGASRGGGGVSRGGAGLLPVSPPGGLEGEAEPGRAAGAPGRTGSRLRLFHAPDSVPMDAPAVVAARRSGRTSIAAGLDLCRAGIADAFFSAGNTGAVAVAAGLQLARFPGVRRPAIAVTLPTVRGATVLLDAGANLAPRVEDLVGYAVLGSELQRTMSGAAAPRVGLLNIGAELGKGGVRLSETAAQLERTPGIDYHGFVEGHDLLAGTTEVVVCDAFTGNAVLKVMEGLAETLLGQVRLALGASLDGVEARRRADAALAPLSRVCDYAEYGGAPLVGVRGVVWVGHGRSHEKAVRNGILAAARAARASVTDALRAACEAAFGA